MTTTTAETRVLHLGDSLLDYSAEERDALPLGTILLGMETGNNYIRIDPAENNGFRWARCQPDGTIIPGIARRRNAPGRSTIFLLPEPQPVPDGCPPVGSLVQNEWDHLPVGTVLQVGIDRTRDEDKIVRTHTGWNYFLNRGRERYPRLALLSNVNRVVSYPPVPTVNQVPPGCPAIGEPVRTAEQFDALPVGTVLLDGGRAEAPIQLEDNDTWTAAASNTGRTVGSTIYRRRRLGLNYNTVHSYPTQEPVSEDTPADTPDPTDYSVPVVIPERTWRVGDYVTTRAEYDSLPPGTRFQVYEGEWYEKCDHGTARAHSGGLMPMTTFSGSRYRILQVGTPDYVSPLSNQGGTFDQFKQRFRSVTYGNARRSGVSIDPLDRAMRTLGVDRYPLRPGSSLHVSDTEGRGALPHGTVGHYRDTDRMVGWHGGEWVDLLSTRTGASDEVVIDHVPGGEDLTWEPSDDDEANVAAFKAEAWTLGLRLKSDNSWCGVFEQTMAALGISQACVEASEEVGYLDVASLPEGTILRYVKHGVVVLFRRDDASTNPARTVRITSGVEGHYVEDKMQVVHRPGEAMFVLTHSGPELDAMPVGTTVNYGSAEHPDSYVKEDDGRWRNVYNRALYRTADFGRHPRVWYSVIP